MGFPLVFDLLERDLGVLLSDNQTLAARGYLGCFANPIAAHAAPGRTDVPDAIARSSDIRRVSIWHSCSVRGAARVRQFSGVILPRVDPPEAMRTVEDLPVVL
jgi:hypothetical protein